MAPLCCFTYASAISRTSLRLSDASTSKKHGGFVPRTVEKRKRCGEFCFAPDEGPCVGEHTVTVEKRREVFLGRLERTRLVDPKEGFAMRREVRINEPLRFRDGEFTHLACDVVAIPQFPLAPLPLFFAGQCARAPGEQDHREVARQLVFLDRLFQISRPELLFALALVGGVASIRKPCLDIDPVLRIALSAKLIDPRLGVEPVDQLRDSTPGTARRIDRRTEASRGVEQQGGRRCPAGALPSSARGPPPPATR